MCVKSQQVGTKKMLEDVPIHLAYFPDPVKMEEQEAGYPSASVRDVLRAAAISIRQIDLEELLNGCLTNPACAFTAICVPGGFAPNYLSRLGKAGAARIRDFVARGGGYLGLCAGAFLGSTAGLSLLETDVEDIHRWARGSGPCQLRFTAEGSQTLGAPDLSIPVTVRYNNGPLLRVAGCGLVTLATFATEFRNLHTGSREGSRMEGSPAIVIGRGGPDGGLVALVSPHLEDGTDATTRLAFANLARLVSRDSFYQQWMLGDGGCVDGVALAEQLGVAYDSSLAATLHAQRLHETAMAQISEHT